MDWKEPYRMQRYLSKQHPSWALAVPPRHHSTSRLLMMTQQQLSLPTVPSSGRSHTNAEMLQQKMWRSHPSVLNLKPPADLMVSTVPPAVLD